jgi:cytochrome c-type biogenesis protein CcmF
MDTINFIGERLWAGMLGNWFIIIAFVAGLFSTVAYIAAARAKESSLQNSWQQLGRYGFIIQGFSIFAVIGLLFYMMLNRYYEYEYVWAHVSDDLPFAYTFSAFWEGQEGSFLLWMFWQVILGFVLIKKAGEWEFPVMVVMALVQTFLISMLLGIYVGDVGDRIGSNPFVLLRDMNDAPLFDQANYLNQLKGKGLNVLLQNYWMVIHPPTLFLGFASTIVPFAYAIAGLWRGKHKEWLRSALPWALFSASVLGTGIVMGGAWAYEALSFGGYWAWDPVENASLVPWITLVAGIHTALIAKNTGYSLKITYFFMLSTFLLIVYSTFLTRSGILGETSVHSFTEMGLEWQLVIFLATITSLAIGFFVFNSKEIPVSEKEESMYSKEFWLFIGSLTLLFSAGLITYTTSLPVFNAVLGTNLAPPEDVVEHHNRFQLWIGVLIGALSAFSQFMRYRSVEMTGNYASFFLKQVGISLVLTVWATIPMMYWSGIQAWQYWLLVAMGFYTIFANLSYVISVLKLKWVQYGAAMSHVGFGMLMIGVVFSGALKTPISQGFTSLTDNPLGNLNKQTDKSILLVKNKPQKIADGYEVDYRAEKNEGNSQIISLFFTRKDKEGNILEEFSTQPNVLFTELPSGKLKFASANPNSKHYLHKDVFTLAVPHWAFDNPEQPDPVADTAKWQRHEVKQGDTIYSSQNYLIYEGLQPNTTNKQPNYVPVDGDIVINARFSVRNIEGQAPVVAEPLYYIRGNTPYFEPAQLPAQGLQIRVVKILPTENKIQVEVLDQKPKEQYIVLQAIIFPLINLVWLGMILMMTGLSLAMINRLLQNKMTNQ